MPSRVAPGNMNAGGVSKANAKAKAPANASTSREKQIQNNRTKRNNAKTGASPSDAASPSSDKENGDCHAGGLVLRIPGEPGYVKVPLKVYNNLIGLQAKVGDLRARLQQQDKCYKDMKERCESLRGEKHILSNTNIELRVKVNESHAALRDAGKSSKNERAKDITNETKRQIKRTTFRNYKFARDDVLTKICEDVYEELSTRLSFDQMDHPLSKEDYVRIYSGVVSQELSARRQYVQTRCQSVCQDYYDTHNTIPTLKDFETIWNLPDENDDAYPDKKALLLWYADDFLPMSAGHDNFGPSIRNFKMAVDKRAIDGVDRVCVTVPSEAFGWLMVANCRDKWLAIFKFKKNNPKAEIPAYDEEDSSTHKFHRTLWSDSKSGQIKGGGWSSEAYTKLNECMTRVHLFRTKDKQNEWGVHALVKDWIREKHGITAVARQNKRKRKSKGAPVQAEFVEILTFADDE